ncbi:bifunctional protein GlmU [Longispora fulva]|uniref:Bifunctional protein GlmU n=1 Tax=Longispora fulva TaxID=619741 RepID=A0A8J7KMC6_9ACTN|nr:bifunctional UDP-N-acetylglucosamine diphosphorylase/glucosamine-1-phosphate N-acetyltransferase GlmU [Longispora fulva]MBG6138996.1 bifunctional UDP-N-acetylglucosamine pyrophosphorylase/glucosamine-1-phosphate N-acetyltransferase [Longispora fulva]GIG58490.1 bifunctional protein GlmU [Longispora fulva]
MRRTVIVLAAGQGKRMRSALPKVMHPLLGRPLVGHVLAAAAPLDPEHTVVVVGVGSELVTDYLATAVPGAVTALQETQGGTGHAARVGFEALKDVEGTVVVLFGDNPLLRAETITDLVAEHEASGDAATVLTAAQEDPTGLGRILRDADGRVTGIVEERDATPEQRAIREINSGIMVFEAGALRDTLGVLTAHNDQGEEYLTDVVGLLVASGRTVGAYIAPDVTETYGCNDRAQLSDLRYLLRDRVNREHMRNGVTMIDPATSWIDVTVVLEPDVTLEPGVILRGGTSVAAGALVGPDTTLVDCAVGEGAIVIRAHAIGAVIGAKAQVGPFAYLRPETVLHERAKIGTFVETKKATVGAGAKIPHLTYAGDATIGPDANIGAATIFVNYDGVNKHHTTVGEAAFVGCDTNLIAPVEVGPGAYVAAGSVIYKDVPAGSLGVTRPQQRNIDGWVERRRAGTKSAAAAARAKESGSAE